MYGQNQHSQQIGQLNIQSEYKISLDNLPKGIYILQIQTDKGYAIKKIVKQ